MLDFDLLLDTRDLQLGRTVGPDYAREISNIKYGIKSYMMTKPSVRPKIEL